MKFKVKTQLFLEDKSQNSANITLGIASSSYIFPLQKITDTCSNKCNFIFAQTRRTTVIKNFYYSINVDEYLEIRRYLVSGKTFFGYFRKIHIVVILGWSIEDNQLYLRFKQIWGMKYFGQFQFLLSWPPKIFKRKRFFFLFSSFQGPSETYETMHNYRLHPFFFAIFCKINANGHNFFSDNFQRIHLESMFSLYRYFELAAGSEKKRPCMKDSSS